VKFLKIRNLVNLGHQNKMSKSETYRPLPANVTIGKSNIDGLGLFATETIKRGQFIGVTHYIINDIKYRTPLGGFYNHSIKANTVKVQGLYLKSRDFVFNLKAIKTIQKGEEILCEYTFYKLKK